MEGLLSHRRELNSKSLCNNAFRLPLPLGEGWGEGETVSPEAAAPSP